MKHLLVMRHAEASPAELNKSDFDRVLTSQGRMQAQQMALKLKAHEIFLENILVSPAERTFTTAKIVAETLGLAKDCIKPMNDIYDASLSQLLSVVQSVDNAYKTILLIGHNPGVSELCMLLSQENISLRPAEMCMFNFQSEFWGKFEQFPVEFCWHELSEY